MDFIASPLGVVLILILVGVAAVSYEPGQFGGKWQTMADWFASDHRPQHVSFRQESVYVGAYAHCDVSLDMSGLWLQCDGEESRRAPPCLFIPWHCMRLRRRGNDSCVFMLRRELSGDQAERPRGRVRQLDMKVGSELGEAMLRKAPLLTHDVSQ